VLYCITAKHKSKPVEGCLLTTEAYTLSTSSGVFCLPLAYVWCLLVTSVFPFNNLMTMTTKELTLIQLYKNIEKAETRREVKALIREIDRLKHKEKVSL
jgi:hypothetical protein